MATTSTVAAERRASPQTVAAAGRGARLHRRDWLWALLFLGPRLTGGAIPGEFNIVGHQTTGQCVGLQSGI